MQTVSPAAGLLQRRPWPPTSSLRPIQAGQAALVDNVNVFFGGDIDSLTTATNRQADGTHLNDTGAASATTAIVAAMHASGAPF